MSSIPIIKSNKPDIPIIKKKKVVRCMRCNRPLMDEDNFRLEKECPSCHAYNRIMVGSDLGVYQFIDEDKTRELKEKKKNNG